MAGAMSGFIISFVLTPIELVKSRLQVRPCVGVGGGGVTGTRALAVLWAKECLRRLCSHVSCCCGRRHRRWWGVWPWWWCVWPWWW
jgi:hypothetical protein